MIVSPLTFKGPIEFDIINFFGFNFPSFSKWLFGGCSYLLFVTNLSEVILLLLFFSFLYWEHAIGDKNSILRIKTSNFDRSFLNKLWELTQLVRLNSTPTNEGRIPMETGNSCYFVPHSITKAIPHSCFSKKIVLQ